MNESNVTEQMADEMLNDTEVVSPIITDVDLLHKKSEPVKTNLGQLVKLRENVCKLLDAFPEEGALGLAAPQIGIFERFFVANLSDGYFVFINPTISAKDLSLHSMLVPSTESCLSLPGIMRCVGRHHRVEIEADLIYKLEDVKNNNELIPTAETKMDLKGHSAFVVQHEQDHLNGVLITDLTEVKTTAQKQEEREQKRVNKINQKRKMKDALRGTENKFARMNPKKRKKLAQNLKKSQKATSKCVKIEERNRLEKEIEEKLREESVIEESAAPSPENIS